MYSYIKGTVVGIYEGGAIIDNNGIGYEIALSNTSLALLPSIGAECKVFVYQLVREDELALYGFVTIAEKDFFIKLISVSGVGPKLALTVLSGLRTEAIANAIISNDATFLSSIKGVGKKTAERIILELRESVSDDLTRLTSCTDTPIDSVVTNALDALESMGLPRTTAYEAVMRARQYSSDITEIVRSVLKGLHNNG